MKIAILDCHNKSYENIAKICNKSKIKYCKIHKIDFLEFKFGDISPYGSTWGRLFGIEHYLKKYEWIFYLDTDVVITKFDFDLNSIIDQKFKIILGRMPDFDSGILGHISTSAILVKNDPWNFRLIDLWKKQHQFISKPYHAKKGSEMLSTFGVGGLFYEQSAFHYLYDTYHAVRKNTKIIDCVNDRESTHNHDSFLIHFARSPKEKRIKEFMKRHIKYD